MIKLPIVKRVKVSVSIREEVAQEFERFVAWAGQFQPDASKDAALEFLVANFFSSNRTDNQAFEEWSHAPVEPTSNSTDSDDEETDGKQAPSGRKVGLGRSSVEEEARERAREMLRKPREENAGA